MGIGIDLAEALKGFDFGLKDFAAQRAVTQANNQVQDLKMSNLSEAEKRTQMQSISNDLVARMAGLGVPATTIALAGQAVGPKQYANANQMSADAILNNDQQLAADAKQQQGFENNLALQKMQANLAAKAMAANDPFRAAKAEEAKSQYNANLLQKVFKDANPQTSSRNNLGTLQRNLSRIQEAESLLQDPSKITLQNLEELPKVVDSVLQGGVATVAGVEHLRANTLNLRFQKMQEMLSGNPQAANSPEFVSMYGETINRIKEMAAAQIRSGIKSVLKSRGLDAAQRDPNGFAAGAEELLAPYGGDKVVSIDPKTKRIVFQSDQEEQNLSKVLNAVVEHADSNPELAKAALDKAKENPYFYGALQSDPKLNAKLRNVSKKFGY